MAKPAAGKGKEPGDQPPSETGSGLPLQDEKQIQPDPEKPAVPDRTDTSPDGLAGDPVHPSQEVVEDPVEILVGLAERGEIDPWNINIIEVTDRFLSELKRRQQLNLQVSGRTLFYASTLLRMKSEQLDVAEDNGEEGDGDDQFGDEFGGGTDEEIDFGARLGPIERLEHEIQRRLDRKNMRKSPITLFELITELKNIEKEERRRRRMSEGHADLADSLIDADDVVSIAHEEGFQETSLTRLAEYLEGLEIDEEMTLAELCRKMEWGIPEVYIPLLFLALDGRCNLRQEEFFGDIFVQICRAEVEDAPAETTAE
jgi:segregation and condensation protein A